MKSFYSQHGEDVLLDKLFADLKTGFFVEVGCIDGKRFSNTLTFEEKGWQGICIEAHRDYIPLIEKNRPNSAVVHAAISDVDKAQVIFYANDRGSLPTLDKSQEERYRREYAEFFSGFKEQAVEQKTLTRVFDEHKIGSVDLISVDIEGDEWKVFKGLDFFRWQPRVLLVECDSPEEEKSLDDILLPQGYIKSARLANNVFYVRNRGDHKKIIGQKITARVIRTKHPLDKGADNMATVKIDTRQ